MVLHLFQHLRLATSSLALGALLLGSAALCTTSTAHAREVAAITAAAAPTQDDTGWQDGGDYIPMGDPAAKRDLPERAIKIWWPSYPPTLRTDGPDSNLVQTRTVHNLMYESLVGIDPNTEEFVPTLAKQWRIETDYEKGRQTFSFKLNPAARFSNGKPVTAEDVHASWWHMTQEDRRDPSNVLVFSQFEEPVIVDEHTVKVSTNKLNWRLFLYFSGMKIFPKEFIKIPGDEYIEKYNWAFIPGSGPYVMKDGGMKEGESLILTRRADWWAENERWGKNTYNFGKVKCVVVRDRELLYQKFLADEFDHFRVYKAQRWVEEIPEEGAVKSGWIKQRKIYNESPQGFAGFAFNMRKPPFDDLRVRKAWAHLFNRERLIEKLFFNEYEMIDSYFPGRDWGNGEKNPKIRFDPDLAEELLWEAGYKERDDDGYLVNEAGERLEVTLTYGAQGWERIWLVVRDDYEDAGIKLNLKLIDPASLIKKIGERQFKVHFQSWGAMLFPNPRTAWSSELADKLSNNNIPGFKNAEVDKLLEEYDVIFDRARQKEIVRRIDELLFEQMPYALAWYGPFERILYWDRFGHPEKFWSRIGDDPDEQILAYWWWDKEKIERLDKARKAGTDLPQGDVVQRPWAAAGN